MLRIPIILIFSIIIGSVYSVNFWECGSTGMKCAMDNTCCKRNISPFGWACFPHVDAVCCDDEIGVCPKGTFCNTNEKKCNKNALAFLEESNKYIENDDYTLPQIELTPIDALFFSKGFLDGVKIFDSAYRNTTCLGEAERFVDDINRLVNIFKNFTVEGLASEIKEILHIVEDFVDISETEIPACKQTVHAFRDVFVKIYQRVSNQKYLEELASHTIFNLGKIKEISQKAVKDFNDKNYFDSGRGFGELVLFSLLWDF